ncbi:SEC-C domain-containing protein [bacterium]|nr:MAG: SEC-C domain-containing protein [bacterium]
MNQTGISNFKALTDGELIELLFISGDSLSHDAVDEFLERGQRMIPLLNHIAADKNSWTRPMPEWWAVVHATYILGSFESTDTLPGLLGALRWADAFDNEWVTEDLPSIFGKVGRPAYGHLLAVAQDFSAGWGARSIALSGLAAIGIRDKLLLPGVLDFAAKIVENETEPLPFRQTAANVLLDFRSKRHSRILKKFGREEALRRDEIASYEGSFYDWEVDEFLSSDNNDLEFYERDWLSFYDPEERQRRQEYWEEERETRDREDKDNGRALFPSQREQSNCLCGSGLPYEDCCMRKVH